jgi:hypothetical protein
MKKTIRLSSSGLLSLRIPGIKSIPQSLSKQNIRNPFMEKTAKSRV